MEVPESSPKVSPAGKTPPEEVALWLFPLAGLLIAVGIAFLVGFLQAHEVLHRPPALQSRAAMGGLSVEAKCGGLDRKALVTCAKREIRSGQDRVFAEQNLAAQQQAAFASLLSSIAAFLSVAITVIGTAFLYRQISLTREALGEAREATLAMVEQNRIVGMGARPWLTVEDILIHWLRFQQMGGHWYVMCSIEAKIENTGTVPAKDIFVSAKIIDNPISDRAREDVARWADRHLAKGNGYSRGVLSPRGISLFSVCPQEAINTTAEDGAELKDFWPGLALSIIYKPIDGSEFVQTVQTFRLSMGADGNTAMATAFWIGDKVFHQSEIDISAGSALDWAT